METAEVSIANADGTWELTFLASLDILLVAERRVVECVLLSNLELVRSRSVLGGRGLVVVWVFAGTDLSRHLGQSLKSSPALSRQWEFDGRAVHLHSTVLITSCVTRKAVQLQ